MGTKENEDYDCVVVVVHTNIETYISNIFPAMMKKVD